MSTTDLFTAEQLLRLPRDGWRYELIAGELKKMPLRSWHDGQLVATLTGLIGRHVLDHDLGVAFSAGTGFLLARDPDTVRAPDVSFLSKARLPAELPQEAYWPGAPDLAVEVVSPGDTAREIDETVKAWLDAGTQAVWVVSPAWHTITVYRSAQEIRVFTANEDLTDPSLLPGLRFRVGQIFAGI